MLSQVIRDYVRARHTKVRYERLRQAESHLYRCAEILGDRPIGGYRPDDIRALLSALRNRYALSASTVNGHLGSLSALFNWAIADPHYGLERNPCNGCRLPDESVVAELRQQSADKPFSPEQLKTFFESEAARTGVDTAYKYWIPLIQLYTGARIGEICQLTPGDIVRLPGGIPAFRLVAANARLSGMRKLRLVPVHPRLIALGLLEHAEHLRGRDTLWPGLNIPRLGSKGQNFGMWLNRHLNMLGLKREGRRSDVFRATFQAYLRRAGVAEFYIQALLGLTGRGAGCGSVKPLWETHPDVLLAELARLDYGIEHGAPPVSPVK
ncbi:integrase [Methylococcus geothermalis]|uniref:Integrase n=1 Tax=Methylococcus geothermalis TaxID=2681310 RepID=A0A858QC61_9GAMM|nr:integrase [Methylococcus geothermalis]